MEKYTELLKRPDSLEAICSVAEPEDLDVLVDYITDKGKGRLALDSGVCKQLNAARARHQYSQVDKGHIKQEILLFGGNSIANVSRSLLRGISMIPLVGTSVGAALGPVSATVEYKTVLAEVAKQVGAPFKAEESIVDIEKSVLITIFKKGLDLSSTADKQKVLDALGMKKIEQLSSISMFSSSFWNAAGLVIASTVANAVANQIVGSAVAAGAMAVAGRPLVALAGPVGIAVGGLWTLAGLSSPAYRVTLPCVVQIAYMRMKYLSLANPVRVNL